MDAEATPPIPVPRHVAVDLTPLLPGGENGGARIFVLELLPRLARMAPGTRFTLLTQSASHADLAWLESANVARLQVLGESASRARGTAFRVGSRVLAVMPRAVRRLAAGTAYAVNARLKAGSGGLMRKLGTDLLFCPFTAPTYREDGIATVCTIYDLQFHAHPEFFTPEDAALREHALRDACRQATRLAAISDFSRAQATTFGHLDPARIETIALRLARRMPAGATSILDRLRLARGQYLLYPANFWKHKNHERLLAAFARVGDEPALQGMKLVLTGAPGEREQAVRGQAHELSLGERVTFAGFVSDAELAALLCDARAVVFPSLYEGFGLPVLEAMAASVPVACSGTTALADIARDAALFFDPQDVDAIARAMAGIVQDEALRERLVAAGRARAAEYSDADRMAREYWNLFTAAMASAR
jgi:glycosyltransferase involved in cell wall biosynthesis